MERIGFYRRAGAFLADLVLFTVVAHAAAALDFYLNAHTSWSDFGAITVSVSWLTLVGLGVMEVLLAATPGKRLLGLKIGTEERTPAPRRALLVRAALKYVPVLMAIFPIVVYATLANYNWEMAEYVKDGLGAMFVVDTVVACGVTLYVIIGCFRVFRPDRQAVHDCVADTAVFRSGELTAGRGFPPIAARATDVMEDSAAAIADTARGSRPRSQV